VVIATRAPTTTVKHVSAGRCQMSVTVGNREQVGLEVT